LSTTRAFLTPARATRAASRSTASATRARLTTGVDGTTAAATARDHDPIGKAHAGFAHIRGATAAPAL